MTRSAWRFGQGRVTLIQGDITRSAAQAVVNAANSRLAGGGGVDGAIHRSAGPRLLAACREITAAHGDLPPGRSVITPGFGLAAGFVIHTVGPIWSGGAEGEPDVLASAYERSLALAREHGLARVAFPAISCGVYGYPVELAAPIALAALRRGAEEHGMHLDLFLHGEDAYAAWRPLAEEAYGRPPDEPRD
ncbi:MAG: macro domain-containing protein [Desulfovibrionaceae bacterium]|nr:macro domain-containing protein [Desulfovibrionaceae bacterium]